MLEINPEIICNIILKSREFHAKEGVVIPGKADESVGEDILQILADHKDDPTYNEFIELIKTLEPDQQEFVIALMYIGRGDFEVSEMKAAKEQARTIRLKDRAVYLITKPLLANYLADALSAFGYSCDE